MLLELLCFLTCYINIPQYVYICHNLHLISSQYISHLYYTVSYMQYATFVMSQVTTQKC